MKNKTEIFENVQAFGRRTDKTLNGVTRIFARNHPTWEKDNETNVGCWSCVGCENCTNCSRCHDCENCTGAIGQVGTTAELFHIDTLSILAGRLSEEIRNDEQNRDGGASSVGVIRRALASVVGNGSTIQFVPKVPPIQFLKPNDRVKGGDEYRRVNSSEWLVVSSVWVGFCVGDILERVVENPLNRVVQIRRRA